MLPVNVTRDILYPPSSPTTYAVGQKFYHYSPYYLARPGHFVLASVARDRVALISWYTGHRWRDAVAVKDIDRITHAEAEDIGIWIGQREIFRCVPVKSGS